MKATELMIGDYVNVEYPGRTEIDKVKAIYQHSIVVERANKEIPEKRVSPVKITREILEKNGWEHSYEKNASGELHKWHKEDGFKQFTVWKNKGRFELGELGCFPFKYVHELQHALRLCGLDDLADNFQI